MKNYAEVHDRSVKIHFCIVVYDKRRQRSLKVGSQIFNRDREQMYAVLICWMIHRKYKP